MEGGAAVEEGEGGATVEVQVVVFVSIFNLQTCQCSIHVDRNGANQVKCLS